MNTKLTQKQLIINIIAIFIHFTSSFLHCFRGVLYFARHEMPYSMLSVNYNFASAVSGAEPKKIVASIP